MGSVIRLVTVGRGDMEESQARRKLGNNSNLALRQNPATDHHRYGLVAGGQGKGDVQWSSSLGNFFMHGYRGRKLQACGEGLLYVLLVVYQCSFSAEPGVPFLT